MVKSQHRTPGNTAPGSGHRFKRVAILALAVSAVGYFAFAPENSESDCSRRDSFDVDREPGCAAAVPSLAIEQVADSAEFGADKSNPATIVRDNSHDSDLQSRITRKSPAWRDNQLNSHAPRPGYTLAERCSTGLGDGEARCQAGSYRGSFNAVESADDSDAASGFSISGRVLTTEGIGLNGVAVVAAPERISGEEAADDETLRFWTRTDSLGSYSLDGLPEGEYTIRSSTHGPYQSARISARSGVDYADLVVSRELAALVEGQVLGSAGEPLEGVTVLPILLGQPSVLTDGDGRFRLPVKLGPTIQSFALRFQRPGYLEQTGTAEFQHPGVVAGDALNVVMQPVEAWTSVSGMVLDESGEPLAGRTVELRPRSAQRTYKATTDHQGRYEFPIVESPADYQLLVFGGANHKDHQESVHVTPEMDELQVVAESYEFGEVIGQLVNPNGIPVPEFELVLRNTGSQRPNVLFSTDEFGNFTIPAAPAGELVVASQSTPSILVQGVRLRSGDQLHLPLVLDWGEHKLHGIVVDARGNPIPASRIVLHWSHQAGGITTRTTRRTAANTQGHFAFSNLGPGPHSLQVDAPGFPSVDIDHDLSRQGYDVTVRLN